MSRTDEQKAALADFDEKSQEITINTLAKLFRDFDLVSGTTIKTESQYRDEAILRLAVARANQSESAE
jgi:hypothetical protein